VTDPYQGREQTKAKHFILRRYLQALAFKILRFSDITYVDGFSGPWKTKTEDFVDSSFRIAIDVLKDAQKVIAEQTGHRPTIRCFFSENNPDAFSKLTTAVAPFNDPDGGFEIRTSDKNFEDAVPEIIEFVGRSFSLVFIDPTGWTGYSLERIRPLFERSNCEVLINFMYDFVNRAASMTDPKTVASLDPILGGEGWENRLDPQFPRGRAIEKLFRDTLTETGDFEYVISTKIDRPTMDRPLFFIVYGTKSPKGLEAFRDIEYSALRANARDRANAKERKRESKTGSLDLFAGIEADRQELSIDDIVEEQKALAVEDLLEMLQDFALDFSLVWTSLLQAHMLRVTNVKDICVELAKAGKIENTWGGGNRKPRDENLIKLKRPLTP
jgi:three-Cys-motif partner protein